MAAGLRYTSGRVWASFFGRRDFRLFEFCEGLFCGFGFFAGGVQLEVELIFGDSFVLLLQLCRNLREGEVGQGVVGLDGDGVFGAEIGALVVFVVHVELCDVDVFVDTLVVGLDFFDFGEFVAGGMNCVIAGGRLG